MEIFEIQKEEKWQTFSTKLFIKIRSIYLPWCCSVVTATSDIIIIWICSDRQLFPLSLNGRNGRPFPNLCIKAAPQNLWYTELHCTGILQGMCGRSARITTLYTGILFVGAIFIEQWLTLTSLRLWNLLNFILGSNYL